MNTSIILVQLFTSQFIHSYNPAVTFPSPNSPPSRTNITHSLLVRSFCISSSSYIAFTRDCGFEFKFVCEIYLMQCMITKFSSSELLKEDNQTCTQASSQLALETASLHELKEENTNEEEPKRQETKLKYRKLKQKLNSIGFQHDDKCVVVKDFTSTKKQRIMKLALDFEKQIKVQNRDYEAMEVVCREIMKIIQAKRELDLQLLRQSRFVPALFELLLKIPSLHKAELSQVLRGLQTSVRILYVFASVSVNREYLILTNRLNGLISFGSWALGRQQKKPQNYFSTIQYYTFKTINSLLLHKSKQQDTNNIISTTIQLILCSPIFKKIRFTLSQQYMQDESITEGEAVLELLRFSLFVLRSATPKLQPDYIHFNQNNKQPLGHQTHLLKLVEFLVQFCFSFFIQLKQTQSPPNSPFVPQSYPTITETALLLTIKIANCCFETALTWLRKSMVQSKNENAITMFLSCCCVIVRYCKHEMEEYNDNNQAKMLLNQIIILLAYLALDDAFVQRKAYEIGLLEEIFNLPVQYIMDSYLRQVYIPTFCCLINDNKTNLNLFLKDNSPQPIIKLLKKEMATHYSITKKSSTTSLMSMTHISHEYSSVSYQSDRLSLQIRFPLIYWESLCIELQKHV